MRNPISWLISQFAPAANKAADAVPHRFVCGTVAPFDPTFLLPSNNSARGQLGAVVAD